MNLGEHPQGEVLFNHPVRVKAANCRDGELGANFRRHWPSFTVGASAIIMMSQFAQFVSKIRGLFGKNRTDVEFGSEMQTHLQLLEEQYIRQGMHRKEAA
ncbi:MAG TPA: hypothetical protein VGE93_01390, partial [Bryobacteraceae bacterium]